eukprot:CAMPEP_0197826526 /NCGR_PEP_ID=MMETSP1437-20131217/3475_1 /TAXON_ID=49252 ORGANISM="Eucampia antarctica, Strain CCMP1452" /NCGR_SAMPLE_ID=MMETSP1437 /ASSEMBLY_ACC=CAM_ASM_001096 /LENGTH=150 /DNA_ID=CAMNT_0043426999 /DNA_START=71 /DNA_END=523 /DNA_ORIENTATION=-
MLMSQGDGTTAKVVDVTYKSALGLLQKNHEFEYLTARVTFIQGLLHWLSAVAFETIIPKKGDSEKTKTMNKFLTSTLSTLMFFMLAFYNSHMTFYKNYGHMLVRYGQVLWTRFIWRWPIRPLAVLGVSSICVNAYYAYKIIFSDLGKKEA